MVVSRYFLALFVVFSAIFFLSFAIASSNKIDSSITAQFQDPSIEQVKVLINFKPSQNNVESVSDILGKRNVIRVFGKDSILALVDRSSLDKVAALSQVIAIQPQRVYKPLLQDAVPLIGADLAWARNISGVNITGVSQTVCVVDGAVDFSHSDLVGKNALGCNLNCINDSLACFSDCSLTSDPHGTAVAGIVGANGIIKGVAPGVKLVGLDVMDGGFTDSASVRSAIDFCVSNATLYNISVISMSLGTNGLTFDDYCDDFDVSVVQGINNAVAKNISVVVSSGNDGDTTGVTSPACAQNAIPVGATNKSDYVASYSDYYSHLKLFAPGSAINSTAVGGGYAVGSGTSFSAPMTSAAIAMINQVLRGQSRVMTPKQIETLLFDNGDDIVDLPNTYGRINIDRAIVQVLNYSVGGNMMSDANVTSEESSKYWHLTANNLNLFFYTPLDIDGSVSKLVHNFGLGNNDGAVKGGAAFNNGCLYGGCYKFDGINDANDDYLNFSTLKNSTMFNSSFTVSLWVKNQANTPYIVRDIVGTQSTPNAAGNAGWVIRTDATLKAQFLISNGTKSVTAASKPANNATFGRWTHIVAVYDASVPSARVYVNNVPGALKSGTLVVPVRGGVANNDFRIGTTTNFNKIWNGYVDDVVIFNKALNATQVSDLFTNKTSRFYPVGQKVFNNLYAGSLGSKVNVTLNSTYMYPGMNYTVLVGSKSGNGYVYGSEYAIINGKASNVPISTPQNVSVVVKFASDPKKFYTPALSSNVTVVAF